MWFRLFRKPPSTAATRRPRSHRPRLQLLEDRCLLSASPLDPTFGSGGIATSLIGSGSFAHATALQADGKILAAGQATVGSSNQFALARYTASGSLDPAFGSSGKVTTKIGSGGFAWALAEQPTDGKAVLGGYDLSSKTGNDFALARYTTSGSLDTSFGSRGTVTTALGSGDDEVEALAIQSDGKILAAGTSSQSGQYEWALARYAASGSLDTSFGSGGKVLTAFGPGSNVQAEIEGIALQSDGKIVVTGYVSLAGLDGRQFAVARYNSNGTLDTAFGTSHTGVVYLTPLTTNHPDSGHSVVIQPDGKIVAAGTLAVTNSYEAWALARFNADGSLDSGFGSGGEVIQSVVAGANVNDVAFGVALQADGKIVVGGTHNFNSTGNPESFALGRFNADGSLDTTFNGTGLVTTTVGTSADARGLLVQPADGKIVLTGGATVNGVSNFALARYVATDPSIGSFTASANPVASGSSETFTVSNIADSNPSATITQVAFYYIDSTGTKQVLGYGTQSSPGVWTLTFTVSLPAGSYTIYAEAEDNYGLFSNPFALALTVQ